MQLNYGNPIEVSTDISHLIDDINKKKRVHLLYGDLRDYISIQDVMNKSKPDYIFHLAAQSYPKTSFESPLDTFETNIQGTSRVLEAVRNDINLRKNTIIHVCASSEVFGRVPKEKLPIDEE